eukprot:COSAG02_NODE_571_length_20173_cov_14.694032_6_plen_391_part_00
MWGSADPQRAAAVATAERVAAEQAAGRMALLERPLGVDVDILSAFFDGASWVEAFDQFFATHCARFAHFGDGAEYSLELTAIHRQFTTTAEALLDRQLGEMAVSADTFMSTLMSTLNDAPPQSTRVTNAATVLERLEECTDFEKFGLMMRTRHQAAQHKPGEVRSAEEEEFAREQQQIREASERRRHARMEAMRRAEEVVDELDAELDRERSTQQQLCPHAELFAGMCTLCGEQVVPSLGSAVACQPEPETQREIELKASPTSAQQFSRSSETVAGDMGSIDRCWDGWEAGSVCRGIVSFWNANDGWGKIKRLDSIKNAASSSSVKDASSMPASTYKTTVTTTMPGNARATTVTHLSYGCDTVGTTGSQDNEIYVHNTHLPMDASRRWLQ